MRLGIPFGICIHAVLLLLLGSPSPASSQGAVSQASCAGCEQNVCVLGCPVGNPRNCSSVCVDGEGWCHYHPGEGCSGGSTEPEAFLGDGTAFSLAFTRPDRAVPAHSEKPFVRTVALDRTQADRATVFRRPCDRAIVGRQYPGTANERVHAETRVITL